MARIHGPMLLTPKPLMSPAHAASALSFFILHEPLVSITSESRTSSPKTSIQPQRSKPQPIEAETTTTTIP